MSANDPMLVSGLDLWAYRMDHHRHSAYIFAPEAWEAMMPVVGLFESESQIQKAKVVGYASIPLEFETPEDEGKVVRQYPQIPRPEHAFFGPSFFVQRKVLEKLEQYHLLPREEDVAEQAWAYAFAALGIKPSFLHEYDAEFMASGNAAPFKITESEKR